MATVEKTIEVDAPVSAVYNQWTQFEEFPTFMEGVEEVSQLSDTMLRWKAKIGGREQEWEAEITQQVPDQRIAWQAVGGTRNKGEVAFEPLGAQRTRVTAHMDYEPEGPVESAGDKIGIVDRRVQGDLERFKQFLEERGVETGAWRGEV